jgi:hypothetical protein
VRRVVRYLAGLAFIVAVSLAALFPLANASVHTDVSVAAFGVAGTLVALVLPAAGLGGDAARRTIDYYVDGMASAARPPKRDGPAALAERRLSPLEWAQIGVKEVNTLRTRTAAARWGSGLAYAALALSMVSMLGFTRPVALHIGRKPVLPWHVTVALALACLVLGAALFLPLAWWHWKTRSLANSERVLRFVVDNPAAAEPPPAAPQDPSSPSSR